MATKPTCLLLPFYLLFLHHHTPTISATAPTPSPSPEIGSTDFIRSSCGATLYPATCYSSLAGYAGSVRRNPENLALAAISVALRRARRTSAAVSALLRRGADPHTAGALRDCRSTLADSSDLMRRSLAALRRVRPGAEEFGLRMSDVETWMSAALTYEDTCTDGLEEMEGGAAAEATVQTEVAAGMVDVKEMTSNALALVTSCANSHGSR